MRIYWVIPAAVLLLLALMAVAARHAKPCPVCGELSNPADWHTERLRTDWQGSKVARGQ